MSKKVKILVVASVVLNVLLAGVIIGNTLHHLSRWSAFRNDRALAARLPPDKYRLFTEVMGGARSECQQIRRQIRETRAQTLGILTAPDFDEQSFQREVAKLRELRGQVSDRMAGATLQLARQFDPEERRSLGRYLERPPRP